MSKKQQLLLVNNFHPETVKLLDRTYQTHHLWPLGTTEKENLIRELDGNCRAAATASWDCDPIVYELGSLEFIAAFGVGVDGIDFGKTVPNGIRVSNTPDVLDNAVADLAMGLILACTRNIINADRFVKEDRWLQGPFPFGYDLAGKTLGIAGLGRIGEAIAQRAEAFKMKIAYHNRNRKDCPYTYHTTLDELASGSDVLLCMLPGGEETRHLINHNILQKLGPKGFFINVGRGTSVDENALVRALEGGQIAGAGLDVYENEPYVPTALKSLENVVLLPHIGSATVETRSAMGHLVINNLEAFFSSQALLTQV